MKRSLALVIGLVLAACDSWSGPSKGTRGSSDAPQNPADLDGGSGPIDASSSSLDGSSTDGALDAGGLDGSSQSDAEPPDAGDLPLPRGDKRAGHVQCEDRSCSEGQFCCTTNTAEVWSACATDCGGTEAVIRCDGPEDCGEGELCCHRFRESGLISECIPSEPPPPPEDGGAPAEPVEECVTAPSGPENRVACHTDADCVKVSGAPLCRNDEGRRAYLGYCRADTDDPATFGHDDKQVVACGDSEGDGTFALCSLETSLCCQSRVDPGTIACAQKKSCGFSEFQILCDGPEDCSAGMCCLVQKAELEDGGVQDEMSVCAPDCAELRASRRCHTSQDCGDAGTCEADPTSAWWGVCVP